MELWIRSQSRKNLMKANDIVVNYNKILVFKDDDTSTEVGEYKTKERTLEVLDEIQNILKPQLLIRRNDDNDKVLLGALQKSVTQKLDMEFKELSTYVYEMPQE